MRAATHLNLAKQNFKFSSAHFLIFDAKSAEMLHGHNYQVEVKVYPKSDFNFDESGYFIDFSVVKAKVKALCDLWDEHILLPALHKDMLHKLSADQKNYEITFRDRFYSFPKQETVWLPVTNTSVEQLSKLFAAALFNELKSSPVAQVEVTIEETRGQSATSQFAL
jgi:6-pyruvoyltetrahydropterin/6-carboxytetrahydropterin synthase